MSVATPGIPSAPPLPAPRPFQRAREAANRIFGYTSRPPSPQNGNVNAFNSVNRFASLGAAQNATASHRTGLEINTLSINESGSHALLGGKEIFKTVKVENGVCVEDVNLRTAIRSTPTQASGKPRQVYTIDIDDVAWAKGTSGDYVAAATSSGKIILYDLGHAGLPAAQLHEHYRQVHRITFNPHRGSLLLSGSQDGTVRLWDVRDARRSTGSTQRSSTPATSKMQSKSKFAGQSDSVRDVKWSPTDGVDFAFGTDSGWVQIWDMRNLKQPKIKIPAHAHACTSVDWHPDGKHVASAGLEKLIRVWDVSSNNRKKPSFEVKTPYPVSNARWRPPCESSVPGDFGTRQTTQLVAAYDREHPVLHIWDLRRPAFPFREMTPHPEAPTDLLWHSQDLLWTVGRDGVFLQSDIQHARKAMDNISVNVAAISATGELTAATMRRVPKRMPNKQPLTTPTSAQGDQLGQSPDPGAISRSWADDSLDNSFLSAIPEMRRDRSVSKGSRPSISSTPPNSLSKSRVVGLDQVFGQHKAHRPQQDTWRIQLPHPTFHIDPAVTAHIAKNAATALEDDTGQEDPLTNVENTFKRNVKVHLEAGMTDLAHTWQLAGEVTMMHLRRRENFYKARKGSERAVAVKIDSRREPQSEKAFAAPPSNLAAHVHVDAEEGWIYELGGFLRELIRCLTGGERMSPQTAAHLILILGPCLPETRPLSRQAAEAAAASYTEAYEAAGHEADEIPDLISRCLNHLIKSGLQPLQVESILSTYHEELVRNRLFVEAAELRKLCYPAFPAVYEQVSRDMTVSLACGSCGKPLSTNAQGKPKCEFCDAKPLACPVCWQAESPYTDVPVDPMLRSQCLLCGHDGHAACLHKILVEEKLGGCPTQGCLCDCTGENDC
jgi:WD40 repeat protein